MSDLYAPEQEVTILDHAYACMAPQRGDVVVIERPGRSDERLLKILVVLPGDQFTLRQNEDGGLRLHVNQSTAPLATPRGNPYIFYGSAASMLQIYETSMHGLMPSGNYFVLGTDPHGSLDSTRFGPIEEKQLLGKVLR